MSETEIFILLDIMQSNGTIELRNKLANGLTLFAITNKGREFSFIKLYEDNKLKEKRENQKWKMERWTYKIAIFGAITGGVSFIILLIEFIKSHL